MLTQDDTREHWRIWAVATVVASAIPPVIEHVGKTIREHMRSKHGRKTEEES